jgi:hypothetical protein
MRGSLITLVGMAAVLGGFLAAGCTGGKALTVTSAPFSPGAPAVPTSSSTDTSESGGEIPLETPTATPSASVIGAGTVFTVTGDDGDSEGTVTLNSVRVSTRPAADYGDLGEKPKFGYFVIFTLSVSATKGTFSFDPYDFYVRADDGEKHEYGAGNSLYATDSGTELSGDGMSAGEKQTRKTMAFDLPARHGRLAYAPNYDGNALVFWRF